MSQQKPSRNLSTPPEHARKRPVSKRKLLANRQNALKATGPRTSVGKSHSRRNAIQHGLFARELFRDAVVRREDPKEFLKMHTDLREVWQPCGQAEELEVGQIATCYWKRLRLWRYENADMRVNLDHVAIRAHVPGPPVPLNPKHGGASTGPRTAEGLARSRRSRWKHGLYSAEARAEQKRVRELLTQSRELLKQRQAC